MSPILEKGPTLPEDIGMHVDTVRQRHPAIDNVWLLAADRVRGPEATWELLAFGDEQTLLAMRDDAGLARDDVEWFVVTDDDRFESVSNKRPSASLSEIRWQIADSDSATYRDPEAENIVAAASRVR